MTAVATTPPIAQPTTAPIIELDPDKIRDVKHRGSDTYRDADCEELLVVLPVGRGGYLWVGSTSVTRA